MAHPIHPALVHFPIACWSISTIADIAGLQLGGQLWWIAGVLLVLGTLTAIAAMLAGLVELGKIDEQSPATQVANHHMTLMTVAWVLYAISLFMRMEGTGLTQPGWVEICLSGIGFLFLCVGGWLGGLLVYGHGVGIEKLSRK